MVVLDYRVLPIDQKSADTAPTLLVEILDKSGSVGPPRKYRNSIVFAVPDVDQIDVLKDRARALIASDVLAADTARLNQFSPEVRKKVEAYQKKASLEARIAVNRCYKHIYFPTNDKSNGHLRPGRAQQVGKGDLVLWPCSRLWAETWVPASKRRFR